MKRILEEFLKKKREKYYIRYKTLTKLLVFTAEGNKLEIKDEYLKKVLNSFLNDEKLNLIGNRFWDNVAYIYDEIINLYEKGEFRRYNSFIDNIEIQFEGKKWFKENKGAILKIIEYYYESRETEERVTLYSNEYFKIENLKKRYSDNYIVTASNPQDMTIRVMLKGKIYYKNGIFLSDGEYLIVGDGYQLAKHKLLSKDIEMLVITLQKKFLEEFGVKKLEDIIQVKSTIPMDYFLKVLDGKFIKENILLFIEVLILVLQVNNLLSNKNIFLCDNEEKRAIKIFEEIEENIKLPDDEIREKIINIFQLTNTKFDTIIDKYHDMTFKKYILNLKIKHVINEFYNSNKSINRLIVEYNILNNNNFYYNLKKYFGISIKVLKKQNTKAVVSF